MAASIIDMDNSEARCRFLNKLRVLRGRWRFEFIRYRPRRSDRQNAFYWSCFVQPFAVWLREQGNDVTEDQAHDILKHKFLRVETRIGGEVVSRTRSTTELDTSGFNEYLDNCANWLAEFCGVIVPEPNEYRDGD